MAFSAINEITKQSAYLPSKPLKELEVNGDYGVSDIRSASTKWGQRYVVEVENKFTVFLPPRVVKAFQRDLEAYEKLLEAAHTGKLSMKYIGGDWNGVEFHEI